MENKKVLKPCLNSFATFNFSNSYFDTNVQIFLKPRSGKMLTCMEEWLPNSFGAHPAPHRRHEGYNRAGHQTTQRAFPSTGTWQAMPGSSQEGFWWASDHCQLPCAEAMCLWLGAGTGWGLLEWCRDVSSVAIQPWYPSMFNLLYW